MGLEAATYIHQLNPSNPVGAVDPKAQGDDHLRLIKSTIQATFPNITGAMLRTQAELNAVGASGITGFAGAANTVKGAGAAAGAATTALRSDVQLVIDLTTNYTWTGVHTFSNNIGLVGKLSIGTAAKVILDNVNPLVIRDSADSVTRFTFSLAGGFTATAGIAGTTGTFSAGVSGTTGTFSAGVSGTTGTFSGLLSANLGLNVVGARQNITAGAADALRVNHDAAFISFFNTAASVRRGYLQGNTGGAMVLASEEASRTLDLTANAAAVRISEDNGVTNFSVGYRTIPQNSQSGNYTAVLADSGKHILHPNGGGAGDTFTIPANGAVAYDTGTAITFVNRDSNSVAIAITTDTMTLAGSTSTGTRTLAQNGMATALKVGATDWIISGTGLS